MKIFISYRREDSGDVTGRLYDRLESRFGREALFIDVDNIPIGVDFREYLRDAVGNCDVLLAVIGNSWLEAVHQRGARKGLRRLDDPSDFVRIEIQSALERRIPVVPVLVGNAAMPLEEELPPELKPLAFRNAAEIRQGRDFRDHVERLVRDLALIGSKASASAPLKNHDHRQSTDACAEKDLNNDNGQQTATMEEHEFYDEPDLSVPGNWDAEGAPEIGDDEESAALVARVVHMSEWTGILADLTLPPEMGGDLARIDVEFKGPPDDRVLARISLDTSQRRNEPVRYFCLNGLKLGTEWWTVDRPVILRVYNLPTAAPPAPVQSPTGVGVEARAEGLFSAESVGVLVKDRFKAVIRAGARLPCLRKLRVSTSRDGQRTIRFTPTIVFEQEAPRLLPTLTVPLPVLAKAGVAWIEFILRIDPDGRLTITARDPLSGKADAALLIVG